MMSIIDGWEEIRASYLSVRAAVMAVSAAREEDDIRGGDDDSCRAPGNSPRKGRLNSFECNVLIGAHNLIIIVFNNMKIKKIKFIRGCNTCN